MGCKESNQTNKQNKGEQRKRMPSLMYVHPFSFWWIFLTGMDVSILYSNGSQFVFFYKFWYISFPDEMPHRLATNVRLSLFILVNFSHTYWYNNHAFVYFFFILRGLRSKFLNFEKKICLKSVFILANSADPEVPHHLANKVHSSLIILLNFPIHVNTISINVSILHFKKATGQNF